MEENEKGEEQGGKGEERGDKGKGEERKWGELKFEGRKK